MSNYFRKTITAQFLFVIFTIFCFMILGVFGMYMFEEREKTNYIAERTALLEKKEIIDDLERQYFLTVFRVRGYVALNNKDELERYYASAGQMQKLLGDLAKLPLNKREATLQRNLQTFMMKYNTTLVPAIISAMQRGDGAIIETISKQGATRSINEFLKETDAVSHQINDKINQVHNEFVRTMELVVLSFVGYMVVILVLISYTTRKLVKNIAVPVQQLSVAAEQLAAGHEVRLTLITREDEIGKLAQSFTHMARTIQEREADLSAHNEELIAQQNELTEQQEKLEQSLLDLKNVNVALNESTIVAITNREGKLTYVNDNFVNASKYRRDELIGQTHQLLNSNYHTLDFFQTLWKTVIRGDIWRSELRNRAKDGSYYWVDTTIVPYIGRDGQPEQFISISTDITTLKETERQLTASISEMGATKQRLESYNELNHALSVTLSRRELLATILEQLFTIYRFDKGFIREFSRDDYVSRGIGDQQLTQFFHELEESLIVKLRETNQSFTVVREATIGEAPLANGVMVTDLYAPILTADNQLLAVLVCTRIGADFSHDEIHELEGVLRRISLSLEKVLMYEETENNRRLNQDIIDNVNEGIQFVDSYGKMVQSNAKLHEFVVLEGDKEWLQQFAVQVIDEQRSLFSEFMKRAIAERYEQQMTFRYEIIGQKRRVVDVYAQMIVRNESKLGTLFVHRDITAEYEVDQMKSDLVSTVSHELRTPLASVLGFTELMLTRELKVERQRKYLETIHKEAKRLTNLINDFLDLQRMESGRQVYKKEAVDVQQPLVEMIETFKVNNPTHDFVVQLLNQEILIDGDREKLIQLITNLIGNAVKFSPNGGTIMISVNCTDEEVFIHIADEGIGIPEEEIPKLFQKFHRIDHSERRKIGGTGLGLAICKEIVAAHQGTISVRSQLDEGSVFTVMFPLLQEVALEAVELSSSLQPLPTVVVVEDDLSLAFLLRDELKETGFHVVHYSNAEEALVAMEERIPEAAVIDIMLGDGMNGWQLVAAMKERVTLANVPIFISSALDEKERAIALGAQHYLTKPYPPSKLSTAILRTLLTKSDAGAILVPFSEEECV